MNSNFAEMLALLSHFTSREYGDVKVTYRIFGRILTENPYIIFMSSRRPRFRLS